MKTSAIERFRALAKECGFEVVTLLAGHERLGNPPDSDVALLDGYRIGFREGRFIDANVGLAIHELAHGLVWDMTGYTPIWHRESLTWLAMEYVLGRRCRAAILVDRYQRHRWRWRGLWWDDYQRRLRRRAVRMLPFFAVARLSMDGMVHPSAKLVQARRPHRF